MGNRQVVQTQIRRRRTQRPVPWRLIRDTAVCSRNILLNCEYKSPYIPKIGNELVLLIMIGLKMGYLRAVGSRREQKHDVRERQHGENEENMEDYLSRDMRFPTMWYVRPTKPQISLRIRAV